MLAQTIAQEAKALSNTSTDLDFFRRQYFTSDNGISVSFVSPYIICFEEYRFYLIKNSVLNDLSIRYHYRPDYLSYDRYATTNLWSLLMYINNIPCIEEFDKERILVPTKYAINNILTDTVKRNPSQELVLMVEKFRHDNDLLFYQVPSVPTIRDISGSQNTVIDKKFLFNKELFTIDMVSLRKRYIPLSYEPIIESVQFKVQGKPTYIYGKHYIVSKESSGFTISWDPKKITNGTGMVDILSENDIIEVSYARKK